MDVHDLTVQSILGARRRNEKMDEDTYMPQNGKRYAFNRMTAARTGYLNERLMLSGSSLIGTGYRRRLDKSELTQVSPVTIGTVAQEAFDEQPLVTVGPVETNYRKVS